ncbi:MAG: ribonuclease HII, partial [Flavobacteriaceae bacterium]
VLFSVDTKGKTDRSSLNMNEDHGIYATAKTLVTLNENTITIKGKNRDLELGVYLPPTIFYVYDKIYVSTTDIQSGQVYLFDSRNEPISNFPVFGNSNIDLADMDNDGNIELVTKDQDNSLIVYSIH